ncbi:unnamed protein product [Chironomus riparius]|uniref:GB1/RHD3-type G domain-containing protein n=1 Tax=Chironomus riparius TaxID=315576 RepID=A0A9N9WYR1_9DIPT|nr:unnamed protein product [Chironomus riparius]CAG9811468.1 unnamed protein product [Chironomus riparius]
MSHEHLHGKPITVLTFSETKEIIIDNDELEKMFNYPEIQERKVVILSLIGAFRGGKSFFLDYCLRFLYAHFPSINNPWEETQFIFETNDSWLGEPDEPLTGFSWRSGTKRDTTGIIMWSDVFLHTIDRTGEKIAIFVMDTQGLFDNESTPADNSRIFALGTVISSIQVLNLMNRVQEDQLQYLQFATEFTKFTTVETVEENQKPFQNLTFLIRDWTNDEEFEFGIEGGNKYFEEEVLKITATQMPELRSVRESIKSSFEHIGCCLLPHPGRAVAGRKTYDGKLSGMEKDFKEELKKFIEHLLLPDNMILKKINAQEITGKELRTYIEKYFKLFQSNEIPETKTIYEMTVESHMSNLVKSCIHDYYLTIYRNDYLLTDKSITTVHQNCKARALKLYESEKKMGTSEHEEKYKAILSNEIEKIFIDSHNNLVNKFKGIEEIKEQLKDALAREKLQKEEAEKSKQTAESKLKDLEEKLNKKLISVKEYTNQKIILTERMAAEKKKLEDIEAKDKENTSFGWKLAKAVGLVLGVGVLAAGLGISLMAQLGAER